MNMNTHKYCNRHWDCMVRVEVVEEVASSAKVVFTISNSHKNASRLINTTNFELQTITVGQGLNQCLIILTTAKLILKFVTQQM